MAAYVVQRCVVLVLLSVRRVRVQAVPELRVALVQLPGQSLVAAHESLTELGGGVAHRFLLTKGATCWELWQITLCLPACLRLTLPPPPFRLPPPFTTGHNLKQHSSVLSFPAHKREKEDQLEETDSKKETVL